MFDIYSVYEYSTPKTLRKKQPTPKKDTFHGNPSPNILKINMVGLFFSLEQINQVLHASV